jgi:hypothetical protein
LGTEDGGEEEKVAMMAIARTRTAVATILWVNLNLNWKKCVCVREKK